jgi:5-bromo-4-chloroindolyl phosphate hydrolysis protein
MLRKKAWFVLVFIAVFLPSTLLAQEMMPGKWWNNKAVANELELTDSERKRLDEKYTEGRRKMIGLKSEVEKERLELDIALDAQDADKEQISKHYDRLEKARAKMSKERFGLLMDVREIVGTERFQSLKEMHRSKTRNKKDRHSKDRSSYRGRN